MLKRCNAFFGVLKIVTCILIIVGYTIGCVQPVRPPSGEFSAESDRPATTQVTALYQQALDTYAAGEYEASAKAFDSVYIQTSDSPLGIKALYGSACAQLMMAETADDYRGALAIWNNWLQISASAGQEKELALMAPIIREKMIFSEIVTSIEGPGQSEHGPAIPLWLYNYAGEKLHHMKVQWSSTERALKDQRKKSKNIEKEATDCKEQVKNLEVQNEDLHQRNSELESQIKEVEIIDHSIQKKKSSIPVAD